MQVLIDYLVQLNWFAVLVASLAVFLFNFLFYSESVLGKRWMKAAGVTKSQVENSPMAKPLALSFFAIFVTATATAVLLDVLVISGLFGGFLLGVLLAVGYQVTAGGMHKLFELRPFAHFWITAIGDVLSLGIIGAILGIWR
jgi:hypothetical protein